MKDLIVSLLKDTKKIGRIMALVVILGISGSISIQMIQGASDPEYVLDQWLRLAEIAVLFYFIKATDSGEKK